VIRIRKEVRNVYDSLFKVLYDEYNDSNLAYERLLEFLAVDNCPPIIRDIDGQLNWFFENEDVRGKLIEAYDVKAVQSERYDHLGDLYLENVIGEYEAKKRKLYFTPHSVASALAKMTLEGNTKKQPNVLDPAVGSGRLLMAAHEYCPSAKLYGVDNSLPLIRTAFTNAAIHSISMYLLHADSLRHVTDISLPEGRENWRHANRWQSQMDRLKSYGDASRIGHEEIQARPVSDVKRKQFKLF
jgi:type I restriction-modification system DNA methylase subunit